MRKLTYTIIGLCIALGSLFVFSKYLSAAPLSSKRNNAAVASRTGLVGYWKMDANDINGTTVYDKSGFNSNGTITGATLASGKIKQALDFAPGQSVSMGNPANLNFGAGSFSVCLWAKSDSTGTTYYLASKSDGAIAGTSIGWYINWASSGSKWQFLVTDPTNSAAALDSVARDANRWYHICGTFNGAVGVKTARLYVDGVQTATASDTGLGNLDVANNFSLGTTGGGGSWDGKLDDVRVYNRVLSAQEVANLYTSAKSNFISTAPRNGLVSYWKMDADDSTATVLYDKSGLNNNATPSGFSGAPTSTSGKVNQAVSFDGANGLFNIATSKVPVSYPMSASFWFYATEDNASYGNIALALNGNTFPFVRWGYGLSKMIFYGASGGFRYTTVIPSPLNTWHHFAATVASTDSSTINVYIDGRLANGTSVVTDTLATGGTAWAIGGGTSEHKWSGKLDEVRIYNRVLSAQEVASIYNAAKIDYVR